MDMTTIINVNGRITPAQDAVVSVLDHGFLYGEGIYEVVRTYDHKPFLFDRHMERLRRSAAFIALPIPLTDEEIAERIRATTDAFFAQPGATADVSS
jgi:branched-subunit amino acid aminotransferase/4-amino-4-deoxychorismate lyase